MLKAVIKELMKTSQSVDELRGEVNQLRNEMKNEMSLMRFLLERIAQGQTSGSFGGGTQQLRTLMQIGERDGGNQSSSQMEQPGYQTP